jgi:ABC-type oligopeptide transport system substrate-binding subunit
MKLIIPLSAITVLATLALVGCDQNSPNTSADVQSTNPPAVKRVPDMNANTPATNSLPDMTTNMPANTNQ